jgi:PAS domain S-box-containing protein
MLTGGDRLMANTPRSSGRDASKAQRLAREKLEEREERLRLAEHAAASGIWEIDIASDSVRGTRQFFLIMGLEPTEEPVPMSVLRGLRLPEDRERVNQGYTAAVERSVDFYESEYRIIRGDGEIRWIFGRGKVIRDASGRPVRYSGIDIDVTDKKNAELALADSEARLKLAVFAGNIGIWDWDVTTDEMTYSEEAKAMYGFPAGLPVTYEMVRDATDPRDLPHTLNLAKLALDPLHRSKQPYEYRIIRSGGQVRWILAKGEATFATLDGVERAVRYTGTIQDITDRKKVENRVRKNEQRLRLALEAGQLAIWEYDIATDSLQNTSDLNRMLGFPEDHPLDLADIRNRYMPGDQERVKAAGEAALAAGNRYFQVEFRFRRPDEAVRGLQLRAEILLDEKGRPSGAIGVLLDVTERKEAEEHRQFLVSELQHRTKNILALVKSVASQTFRGEGESENLKTFTSRLVALGNAHDLLHGERPRETDLREIVNASMRPHGLSQGRFDIGGPALPLSPRQGLAMSLALNELATNAAKYGALLKSGGQVQIRWQRDVSGDASGQLVFTWTELGGPDVVPPNRTGFGTSLIKDHLAFAFAGAASFRFERGGLRYELRAPWPNP